MSLNNVRIGTRLSAGFALMLFLVALILGLSIWRTNTTTTAVKEMMSTPLVKERLLEEQLRNVAVGVTRGKAIAKSSDASLEALFRDEAKASTARGNEIIKALADLPSSPKEQQLLDKFNAARKAYLAARDPMMAAKRDGNTEEANRIFDTQFAIAGPAYVESLKAVLEFQHKAIDDMNAAIQADATANEIRLAILGAIAIVLGAMAAVMITRSITRPVAQAGALVEAVAAGDLSQNLHVDGSDEIAHLVDSLKRMNTNLHQVVTQVRDSSDSIRTSSAEIAQGNLDLSSRTESQASSLEETASSMEELTSTVRQNADNSRQANQLAQTASEVAIRGGAVVSQVVQTMGSINESSRKIVDIIGVIDGIAFQTNILALNAAVEAARAGEQGRGFAVVASEVRNLAQRSAAAAKEIKSLIDDSVEKVDVGSKLVDQAGETMDEVVNSIRRVTDIMAEITTASAEQSAGIEQVSDAITDMDNVTQQNAALVEEAAAAAGAMQEQAESLNQIVSVFKLDSSSIARKASVTAPARSAAPAAAKAAAISHRPKRAVKKEVAAPKALATHDAESDWEQF